MRPPRDITPMPALAVALGLLAIVALAVAAIGGSRLPAKSGEPAPSITPRAFGSGGTSVWAVGDGADGGAEGRAVGAMLAAAKPDRFLYLGDVYENGTRAEFDRNYAPAFGALKDITLPTPGNHDWPEHEQGYDPYWSTVGGRDNPEIYSSELSSWELISLNSEAPHDPSSPQWRWLSDQLADGGNCRIAFWHRPRYSAGSHGDQADMEPIWDLLASHAALVLNGHEHNMQRLKPIDGITTLISGAGGQGHYAVDESDRRLAFSDTESYGALQLNLRPGLARWRFVALGGEILDRGQQTCRPSNASAPAPERAATTG